MTVLFSYKEKKTKNDFFKKLTVVTTLVGVLRKGFKIWAAVARINKMTFNAINVKRLLWITFTSRSIPGARWEEHWCLWQPKPWRWSFRCPPRLHTVGVEPPDAPSSRSWSPAKLTGPENRKIEGRRWRGNQFPMIPPQ